jgi:DNA-binding NarL/FixJ family response regulator
LDSGVTLLRRCPKVNVAGATDASIARQLWLTEKTVETHVRSILGKLDLPQASATHRRVLAVVTYLRASVA